MSRKTRQILSFVFGGATVVCALALPQDMAGPACLLCAALALVCHFSAGGGRRG